MTQPPFNIAAAFRNKAIGLRASFFAIREVTSHGPTIGDRGEADWVGLMRDFLPTRYVVGPIFAVDHHGAISEQIDAAVYDTHFSPQWFGAAGGGIRFVPIESVYAVFEVKPEFNTEHIEAARKKVASVRRLERTSQAIYHKGGKYEAQEIEMAPIIGGILTTRAGLTDPVKKLQKLQTNRDTSFLDIGLCLDQFAFDYTPTVDNGGVDTKLTTRFDDDRLIHFCIRLFQQLQMIGSVPAVDMTKYEKRIFAT